MKRKPANVARDPVPTAADPEIVFKVLLPRGRGRAPPSPGPRRPIGAVWQREALSKLAVKIFRDRNARGMPKKDRLTIKAVCLPHLRRAIRAVRESREALRAGDVERHELLYDRARMHFAFSLLEMFGPFANREGARHLKISERSTEGGKATASKYERPDIDDVILACIKRGDRTRPKEWAGEFGVSLRTMNRKIARIRAG